MKDLLTYYHVGEPRSATPPLFTGGWFDQLGGGGDRPDTANRITAEDLMAVEMLGVQYPAKVALWLLVGDLGVQLSALLAEVPRQVDLASSGNLQPDPVADGGPADRAWQLLINQPNVRWVKASKLLARKRPRLLPIYDSVVAGGAGYRVGCYWTCLRRVLQQDDSALHRQLVQLKGDAGLPDPVSPIRILDVAVWMRHRQGADDFRRRNTA
ncbi:hypothetical protein JQS43_21995 [Natronosporangium hydrolyticum]|uniref:Uncharacterized protein n=1 Tax=Natronosporangium hydrolyticum TaxID=2811111 RepID=A0A895YHY3_9ACTN|nr:DUF6308 family protein [Natronosporangium hydrolyticum]QSB14166.1 hypothetical protein JQS43_21995 [Natronosporangium hydrolyticum]